MLLLFIENMKSINQCVKFQVSIAVFAIIIPNVFGQPGYAASYAPHHTVDYYVSIINIHIFFEIDKMK